MTPPILARVAQLHGSSEEADCNTISTTTSWEYVSKSSSLSDLTRLGAAFLSPLPSNQNHSKQDLLGGHTSTSSVLPPSQNHPLGRSLLPLGIVPLPPPHKLANAHSNGYHPHLPHHGYRLTQKDLLQPSTGDRTPAPPSLAGSDTKNDSNPVMRSTSFNLDYGAAAAKRQNLKYRQPLNGNRPSRISQSQFSSSGKPRQQAIVLVAENPESGNSDVYNVPFSSDIYSLPVDSLLTASSGNKDSKKASSSSKNIGSSATSTNNISQTNLNQRLKSETVTTNPSALTPPPPRKNNLSRRTSCGSDIIANEHGTKVTTHNNLSSHSRDLQSSATSQPEQQRQSSSHVDEPKPCKPPQRSTSLSSAHPQPPPNEIPTTANHTSNVFAHIAPPPPLPSLPTSSTKPKTPAPLSEFKPIPPERTTTANTTNHVTSTSSRIGAASTSGHTLNSTKLLTGNGKGPVNGTSDPTPAHLLSVKKPRSRSVDPAGELERESQGRTSIKRAVDLTYTSNINFNDNPSNNHSGNSTVVLPPLPTEPEHSQSIFHGNSSKEHCSTADRKNPLGISILNLFRRNKGGPSGAITETTGVKQSSQTQLKPDSSENGGHNQNGNNNGGTLNINNNKEDTSYYFRELPPPPPGQHSDSSSDEHTPAASPMECRDFAASIEKVKDCGWYWGPLSSEAAEDLLKNEPDGSFIVRDSSDARYIFSLTFKLHGLVRHVRIEHDQGNFSFGPLTRFKAATIVDFVEKAVAHSRSGRYLFFLHRRPVLGPMQVQLLHPYSRFMHARSLKHMCRFVILKYVRRDLIHTLPLPKPMQDYLNTPHYYFEPPDRNSGGGSTAAAATTTSATTTTTTSHHHSSRLA